MPLLEEIAGARNTFPLLEEVGHGRRSIRDIWDYAQPRSRYLLEMSGVVDGFPQLDEVSRGGRGMNDVRQRSRPPHPDINGLEVHFQLHLR